MTDARADMTMPQRLAHGLLSATLAACMLALASDSHAGSFTRQIASHEDDSTASSGTSGYRQDVLYTPYSSTARLAFWRWRVNLPPGATVDSASLLIKAYQQIGSTPSTLSFQLVTTNQCPSLASGDTYVLPVTSNSVSWIVPGNWAPDGGEAGAGWYRSANIAPLVQAFIDRPDYKPNSYMGLRGSYVSGGTKMAWQYTAGETNFGATLEVNYSGGSALLSVHMADPEVRSSQKIYCEIVNARETDALIAFLNEAEVFRKEGGLDTQEVFTVNYADLPVGDHELTIRVSADDAQPRATFSRRWRKLHAGVGAASINADNALCRRGELFFPLHSYMLDVARLDSPMGGVINTLRCEGYYPEHTPETFANYLSHGARKGLPVVGPERWSPNDPIPIESFVMYNRDHPALLGWAWDDEPDLGGSPTPPTEIRRWTDICHSNDTSHPVWVNFSPDAFARPDDAQGTSVGKSYCYEYNESAFGGNKTPVADVIGFDVYPYEFATKFSWMNIDMLATGIKRARAWNRDLLPVVAIIESQDVVASTSSGLAYPWTPGPTPTQLKNLIWICIVSGAKGIGYFHYFCPTPEENIAILREANAQITELTPIILSTERSAPISALRTDSGRVDSTARTYAGTNYIFAVNMRDAPASVHFSVPGLSPMTPVSILYQTRTLLIAADGYTDELEPFGVAVYAWPAPTGARPAPPQNLRRIID